MIQNTIKEKDGENLSEIENSNEKSMDNIDDNGSIQIDDAEETHVSFKDLVIFFHIFFSICVN